MKTENPIIVALNELAQLEWAKVHPDYSEKSRAIPPLIVARFIKADSILSACIKQAVDSFQGNVVWVMQLPVPPRRNFVIGTARVLEPTDGDAGKDYTLIEEELIESSQTFCESAIKDVPALAATIRMVASCPR